MAGTVSYYDPSKLGIDANGNWNVYLYNQQMAAQKAAPAPGAGYSTPTTTSDPWLSGNELNASVYPSDGFGSNLGSGGGGSGGSLDSSATAGAGGLLGGGDPSLANANSSPGFNSLNPVNTQPVGYQSPLNGGAPGGVQGSPSAGGTGSTAPGSQGMLNMQQQAPQSAISAYQNTPGYQMLGNDQTNQYQQSPGYQHAVNEALRQVNGQASSRGLLESGSALRGATNAAVGAAQQDYGNWWNRQNQLYGDYQNRLAGLAGGQTGGDQAMQTGQGLGATSLQTGNNLSSLFGNQGNAGLGAYTNTGAAQANTMQQAANTQLQVGSANNSTLLAGAMMNKGSF